VRDSLPRMPDAKRSQESSRLMNRRRCFVLSLSSDSIRDR
jgi:hypothetical protein